MIRRARIEESKELSSLALRSKAHWRYSQDQLLVFRDELTVAAEEVAAGRVFVYEADGELHGFFSLSETDEAGEVELEHLFVDPSRLRRGTGRSLFNHARAEAKNRGFRTMRIQSDPNASGFYDRLGAVHVDDIPSSIPGRSIPMFRLTL